MKPLAICGVFVLAMASFPDAQASQKAFKTTTVQAILKAGKRADGTRVELRGKMQSGFETSIFSDASTPRWIWLEFDRTCTVVAGGKADEGCMELIDRLERPLQATSGGRPLRELDHVIVRGVVFTVRRDIKYAKSVPKSARKGGFGHLGAYLAEIMVEEVEIEQSH